MTTEPHDPVGRMVDDHAPAIYRYLARRVGSQAAEDLTADVVCAAIAGGHTYDPARGTPIAWLMGIATNALTRYWRTEQRQLDVVSRLGTDPLRRRPMTTESPERHATESDQVRAVSRALVSLPPGEREALLLFAWADLPYADVAAALDVPVGTVRSRIARARERLRAELGTPPTNDPDLDARHDLTGGTHD